MATKMGPGQLGMNVTMDTVDVIIKFNNTEIITIILIKCCFPTRVKLTALYKHLMTKIFYISFQCFL